MCRRGHARNRPRGGAIAWSRSPGLIQLRFAPGTSRTPVAFALCAVPALEDRGCYLAAVEGGDIGGVDGVGEVADGVDAGSAGRLGCIDEGAERVCVDRESRGASEFVVWNPVAGDDDGVAFDDPACAGIEVFYFDRVDAWGADDSRDACAGLERQTEGDASEGGERGVGLGGGVLSGHEDRLAAGFAECHRG